LTAQGYSAEGAPVAAPGAEALATAAAVGLWRAAGRLWPLWLALTAFQALNRVAAKLQLDHATGLQKILGGEASALALYGAAALACGVGLRLVLDRPGAWKLDRRLGVYAGISLALTEAPNLLLLGFQTTPTFATQAEILDFIARSAMGLVGAAALFLASLRLALWPVARLMGDETMTATRAWGMMRGATVSYLLALILLGAPLVLLNLVVVMLARRAGGLAPGLAGAPLGALTSLVAMAVSAEIYRARAPV